MTDANNANWNNLRPAEMPPRQLPYTTRDVAMWARDQGYDGVHFLNIRDSGWMGLAPIGDVYAFFHASSQVKSADPVTVDDDGEIIPLDERFDPENVDIRFSQNETPVPTFYSQMAKVVEQQKAAPFWIITER